nr:putative athila retroelement ORF1 protein [Tanacetum cinerariifolium]
MAQMLQAPIEGYEDAIVVPPINANNFELKQTLINLVQSNQFTGPGCRFELGSDGASGEGCWVVVERQENRGEVVLQFGGKF